MELFRFGNSYTRKARTDFIGVDSSDADAKLVQMNFFNFGRGHERTSDFGVILRWADIEDAIKAFSDMGHPGAIKLRNAISLASAAEEAGWQAADTSQSN